MKKLLFILLISGLFISCKDDDKMQPELKVEPLTLSFGVAKEEKTFEITANIAWTIASSESWCTVEPKSGNGTRTIAVTVTANDGTGMRPATITITSSELGKKEIAVTQLGLNPMVVFEGIENDEVEASIAEEIVEVKLSTNVDLEVEPKVGWIHFLENVPTQSSVVGRTLKFKLDENDTGAKRSGEVEIKDKNSDFIKVLTFTQPGSWRSADSLTLLKVYEKMDGENWDASAKWDITKSLDQWSSTGVRLSSETGRVEVLNIYIPENLSAPVSIPVELADLNDLKSLRIVGGADNVNSKLQGVIPAELGQFSKLEMLIIIRSGVSGNIPVELSQLSSLGSLLLHTNQLTGGIPTELSQLSNLGMLVLYNNQLTGSIPTELGSLSALNSLGLKNNQLSGAIPTWLLSHTKWEEWKDDICPQNAPGGFTNCGDINSRQTDSLALLKIYEKLGYGEGWTAERKWDLSKSINHWAGVVLNPETDRVESLTFINVNGTISPAVGDLNKLMRLFFVGSVNLTGSIPPEIGLLNNLVQLNIENTSVSGSLPVEIAQMDNIRYLFLNNNKLTGNLHPELGQASNLITIRLSNNQLEGSIPAELGQLTNLTSLTLYSNQLTGSIPPELGQLSNLEWLDLGLNKLTGEIPSSLGQLNQLEDLSLSYNQLSGAIPAWLLSHTKWEEWKDGICPQNAPGGFTSGCD